MRPMLTLLFTLPGLLAQAPPEAELAKDLAFLAGPELKGRGNGSPELDQAAAYLVKRYQELGLRTQVQRFPFVHRIDRLEASARITKEDGTPLELAWGKDIEAYGFSADADLRKQPLRFAGYGLKRAGAEAEEADCAGKVVVLWRSIPQLPEYESIPRMEKGILARIQRFEQLGARAVILLESEGPVRKLQREEGPLSFKVPVLSLRAEVFQAAFGDPAALKAKVLPGSLDLTLKLKRQEAQVPNVVALLPGSDRKLREEFIVLGAHLDHLGLGERHSLLGEAGLGKVHPGADDNASGTAMLLEMAKRLRRQAPKRSVLFLHVSGEEEGLLGSAFWLQHPMVAKSSIRFMLNFDMVGRLDEAKPTLLLGGLGAPKAYLDRIKTFAPQGLALGGDLGMAVGGSDHMSFAAAKIPTFFFFTGVHTDYHRPSDLPEKLNVKGMLQVVEMAQKVVLDLTDTPTPPAFDPETAKIPTAKDQGPVRVSFGSIPDFTENPKGFRINGTSPGSPAEALGLQAGDILVSFDGKAVKNIYDFQAALSGHKPGDKVKVQWLRGETPMEGEATLKAR